MASALRFLLPPPLSSRQNSISVPRCSSSSPNPNPNPNPEPSSDAFVETPFAVAAATTSFGVERRVPSAIVRDPARRPGSAIERPPEPPNFEIGWKRTKEIAKARPKGWAIADFLEKLEGLMGRGRYGSAALLAKVAEVVAEQAQEEAEAMAARGEVEERRVTELRRILKLIEMDVEMVRAAAKDDTIRERIETARARCRQAILVALSL